MLSFRCSAALCCLCRVSVVVVKDMYFDRTIGSSVIEEMCAKVMDLLMII